MPWWCYRLPRAPSVPQLSATGGSILFPRTTEIQRSAHKQVPGPRQVLFMASPRGRLLPLGAVNGPLVFPESSATVTPDQP